MSVERIREDPRVTRPYTDAQWAAIDALGDASTSGSTRGDVRLTHGRRADLRRRSTTPTRRSGTSTALGGREARARRGAAAPAARAASRPAALLHFGQGKWYPGESLPRWALRLLLARATASRSGDDPALFADARVRYGYGAARGAALRDRAREAARRRPRLRAARPTRTPGTTCGASGGCPSNVDPHDSQLDDPEERARLARVFEQGLGAVVGYALPLQPRRRWSDERRRALAQRRWFLRRERLYLTARATRRWATACRSTRCRGWRRARRRGIAERRSVRGARAAAAPRAAATRCSCRTRRRATRAEPRAGRGAGESAPWIVRTALCVEPRDGMLHVFLPPVARARGLPRAGRARSRRPRAALRLPVRLEGYTPPPDPRLREARGHARSRRDRGERRSRRRAGASSSRTRRASTRTRALARLRSREVHARRPPHRHRRRQPRDARRADRRRQPAPAPARSAAQPDRLLAESPVALVPVLRAVHRADEPGAARRRGAQRRALRARDRASRKLPAARATATARRPGWSTACSATCSSTSPATRTAPSSASTSSTRPTARAAGSAWSSCAPSRCRRTRA